MLNARVSRAQSVAIEPLERRSLLSSLVLDNNGIFPSDSVVVGNLTFFTADDGVHGKELWKSDGTPSGTAMVKDIQVGPNSDYITNMAAFGNLLMFVRYNQVNASAQTWRSDGTEAGTYQLTNFGRTGSISPSAIVGGKFLFIAHGGAGNPVVKLFVSDGTVTGTHAVKDLANTPDTGWAYRIVPTADGQRAIFEGGEEIWSTDGTSAGTINLSQQLQLRCVCASRWRGVLRPRQPHALDD